MGGTVLSAHNPMTGPRHLGHFASTMLAWPRLAAQGELIVIVDDLIASLLYPRGRHEVEAKSLAVVREFAALDVDFSKNHIVLTSMLPEAHELAFYASIHLSDAWCHKLFNESFAGILTTYQRAELGLPPLPSIAEVIYPQCFLAAVTMGLRADFFQGGEEMRGYLHIMDALAARIPSLKAPNFLAGAPFVLGTDGQHMASENAIYISADNEEISSQLSKVNDKAVFYNWALALREATSFRDMDRDILASDATTLDHLRSQVEHSLLAEFAPFRKRSFSSEDIVSILERSSSFARERLSSSVAAIKREMKVTGFRPLSLP
jgi:tryptophanyl-tRNA synthetase